MKPTFAAFCMTSLVTAASLSATALAQTAPETRPSSGPSTSAPSTSTPSSAPHSSSNRPTSAAPAAASSKAAAGPNANLAREDVNFLKEAAQAGLAEVESSKLAAEKASDPAVKTFARQMVDDHTKANEELMALAKSKGVTLPTEPSTAHKAKLKMLSARTGSSFDQSYVSSMGVPAHQDAVKLFTDQCTK